MFASAEALKFFGDAGLDFKFEGFGAGGVGLLILLESCIPPPPHSGIVLGLLWVTYFGVGLEAINEVGGELDWGVAVVVLSG